MNIPTYMLVAAACALLNNVLVIAFAEHGYSYALATLFAFGPVLLAGFLMHCRATFGEMLSLRRFARYTLAVLTSYPAWMISMYVFCSVFAVPVRIAAPVTTLLMFAWNLVVVRWALRNRSRQDWLSWLSGRAEWFSK